VEVVGNGAWRITPVRASGGGDIYRGNMVGNMMKERKKYSMEGMAWRTSRKWQQNVTHGDIDMPDPSYWRCLLENVVV
jgi:hypothetical protein